MKFSLSSISKPVGFIVMCGLFMTAPNFVRAHEGESMNMNQHQVPAQFEKLKRLVGTWSGTTKMNGQEMPYTVTYELTAGGTALLERLFVGSPHEMVSIYYPVGKSVEMTHYCMLGNQPHMVLDKTEGNTFSFDMEGTSGITSTQEPHMHHLSLTFVDADHVTAKWVGYEHNKKNKITILELTRKS